MWARRLRRTLDLERRQPGTAGDDEARMLRNLVVPWWSGRVAGQAVALVGDLGFRFSGQLVVGAFDWNVRMVFERRRRSRPLQRVVGTDRVAGALLAPTEAAVARLSPRVRRVEVGPSGVHCGDYGSAGHDDVVRDLTVLAELVAGFPELPDPPVLAAVRAGDAEALAAALDAGEDPRWAGPRDLVLPGVPGSIPETAMLAAVASARADLVRLLAERGGVDPVNAHQPILMAVLGRDPGILDAVLLGAAGLTRAWDLAPALTAAVEGGWQAGVVRLLEAGAEPKAPPEVVAAAPEEIGALLADAGAAPIRQVAARSARLRRRSAGAATILAWAGRVRALVRPGDATVREAWAEAASLLGLEVREGSGPGTLAGSIAGHPVTVVVVSTAAGRITRIEVGGVPDWLSVRPESLRERLGLSGERFITPTAETQWQRTNDVLTGDHGFDGRIDLRAPVADGLALMSHRVRELLLVVVEGLGGVVSGGVVRLEIAGVVGAAEVLRGRVEEVFELARSIAHQVDRGVAASLADLASSDPDELVRTRALETLGQHFPGSPETVRASRAALRDGRYDWLRMTAASLLHEEGSRAYRQILADPTQRSEVRGMALRHLGFRGGPEAEDLALAHLDDPASEVVLHAVRVLGERCGTARSVAPLERLAGGLAVSETARAAAAAVKAIQSRLEHAAPGQLSLVGGGGGGELSLAGDEPSAD